MKRTLCFAALSAGALFAGGGVASAKEIRPRADQPSTHPPTVAAGETLSQISESELGASDRWPELFALNREILASPDLIEVGQTIDIPSNPVADADELSDRLAPEAAPAPTRRPLLVSSVRQEPDSEAGGGNEATVGKAAVASGASGGGVGGFLASVRACESGGDYSAVSADGRYGGAYQFDRQTWQSVGGSGDPAAASPAEQDARASRLRSLRASNPWPSCG